MNSLIDYFFFIVQMFFTCDFYLVNCNVMITNNSNRYEISIKTVLLYSDSFSLSKYHTLVMNWSGPQRLTGLDIIWTMYCLFVDFAFSLGIRQVDRLVLKVLNLICILQLCMNCIVKLGPFF